MKQKLQRRRGKDNAVKAIQYTAVTHENTPVILDAEFPLDIGKDQITELGNHAQRDAEQAQRYIIGLQAETILRCRAKQ